MEVSWDFVGEVPSSKVTNYLCLGSIDLLKVEIWRFWFVRWLRGWCVTWLCRWGSLILSHHPAKFRLHRPCESGNINLICHVITVLKCRVTLCVGPHIISHQPAKFGLHRPCESRDITFLICHLTTWTMCQMTLWVGSPHSHYGTGNKGVCCISSNSNSNFNPSA